MFGQRPDTFLCEFWHILLTIGSIYTKLGDFVKLGLHFMTTWPWINSFYRLVPSPSRFELQFPNWPIIMEVLRHMTNFKSCPGRSGTVEHIWTKISTFMAIFTNSIQTFTVFSFKKTEPIGPKYLFTHNDNFGLWRWVFSSFLCCVFIRVFGAKIRVHETQQPCLLFQGCFFIWERHKLKT